MAAPSKKRTGPTDGNLCKRVRSRNHLLHELEELQRPWTCASDDDFPDLLSHTRHPIVSSDDEPQSPQSSEKDCSFDMDPNGYPACTSTPNQSLQLVDIVDVGIDSPPSLPHSSDIDSSHSLPPSPEINDQSQT